MTIDIDKLRELATNAPVGPYDPKHKDWDAFKSACTLGAILVLLDELDRLRDQVRQHEAFQQLANASEQQRLNDARLEGWRLAQQQAADKCQELENESSVCNMIDGADCADAIRALHPPAEWSSSEQCGAAPNASDCQKCGAHKNSGSYCNKYPCPFDNPAAYKAQEWPHNDGFGGGLMGEKE